MAEPSDGRPSILVTGFGPFAAHATNPSGELLPLIAADPPPSVRIRTQLLPVDREQALLKAIETMDHYLPGAVLALGLAEGREDLCVERVAINVDEHEIPDTAGRTGRGEPIDAAGPAAYFATLPVHAIVERMRSGGVPARVSNTAGTFVCNRLLYALLHYVALRGQETWFKRQAPAGLTSRIGFIHVPATPELARAEGKGVPALPIETTLRGVRLAIEAVGDELVAEARRIGASEASRASARKPS